MVFCTKCGKENEDSAGFCTSCGAALQLRRGRERSGDECFGSKRDREREECFGLPYGGMIAGVIFGIVIIVIGLAILWGLDIWRWIGPLFVVMLGILIVLGAVYTMTRRKS